MKNSCLLLILIFNSVVFFSQIQSGKTSDKKEKPVKSEFKKEYTLVYINYTYGNSFRTLQSNKGIYGREIGDLTNEKAISSPGFNFGVNTEIHKNLKIDLGLGFAKFGEQRAYTQGDSAISYTNSYSNILIPLKVQYEVGKRFKFFTNAGLQAQLLSGYKNETKVTYNQKESTSESKKLTYLNSFSLAAVCGIGFQYHFSDVVCMQVSGDYIRQLTSSYNKQAPYIHRAYRGYFSIGLGIKI